MTQKKTKALSRKAQGEETRRNLLETGARLFGTKGYHAVSMRALASEASVNLATIGYHFGGKPGLYTAIMEDLFEERDKMFPQPEAVEKWAKENGAAPAARIQFAKWFSGVLVRGMLDDNKIFWSALIISREIAQPTDLFPRIEERLFTPSLESIRTFITYVRPDMTDPEEITITAHCYISIFLKLIEVQHTLCKRLQWDNYSDNIDKLMSTLTTNTLGLLGLSTENA